MQSQDLTPEFFIKPGCNLQIGDPDYLTVVRLTEQELKERWLKSEGRYIRTRWKTNNYDRKVIESHVGKYYDHLDLRGIDLSGEDLRGCLKS